MKVKDLQEKLSKLDPHLEVLCYSEDESLRTNKQFFRLFDIEAVSAAEAERTWLDDGVFYLKFGKSPSSEVLALLEVTTEF